MVLKLTPAQANADLPGLNVNDATVCMDIIRRLIKSGALDDTEITHVAVLRQRLKVSISAAIGIDYDNPPAEPVVKS